MRAGSVLAPLVVAIALAGALALAFDTSKLGYGSLLSRPTPRGRSSEPARSRRRK
jgi:hypothetical protein